MPKLCPLFSGSSGNSYYFESGGRGVLIDCGRNAKQLENALKEHEIDISRIEVVFITHEHGDHINALRVFAGRHKLKVYASYGTMAALEEKGVLSGKFEVEPITLDGVELDHMDVIPFRISHDCAEGFGYVIETQDGRKTGIATDTGIITPTIREALTGCDTVVLESNHDTGMLQCGAYPYVLKRRIMSEIGHLSNEACAETAVDLVKNGTTRLMLAHLSKENNIPELAMQATLCELESMGMIREQDFLLSVLPETYAGRPMIY